MKEIKFYQEKARDFFLEGYNCSQSVVLAFADEIGISSEFALKMSSSFGGGMGRLREVCGAVSGMFMIAGIKYGYTSPNDNTAKMQHYKLIQDLAESFREINESIVCREILQLRSSKPDSPVPSDRTPEYYKNRPCAKLVYDAAGIIGKYISEHE